jgi:hypothetical protein
VLFITPFGGYVWLISATQKIVAHDAMSEWWMNRTLMDCLGGAESDRSVVER